MSVFVWFPKGKWQLVDEKTDLYLFTIYTNRDATISKYATNETKYSVLRRVRAQRGCPRRNAFADYLKLVTLTHEKKRRCPRGRIDDPDDDTLAMTALADSNLPTLLLTDFKI